MKPIIIAHRGYSAVAPENTMKAFELALHHQCDGIELDVHLSKDQQFVVCHDPTINRTTNGSGVIKDMNVSELQKYDAGSWFNEDFQGEKIPLLEDVLDLVPQNVLLNIEIKTMNDYYEGIEARLIELLKRRSRLEQIVVSSFDHKCLQTLKKLEPDIQIGLLYSCNFVDTLKYVEAFGQPIYSLHPSYKVIYNQDISSLTDLGINIFPYTINDEDIALHLQGIGASGLITDQVSRIGKAVG